MLFDQVILSKRNRGRTSMFSKSKTNFLSDSSDHLWRSAAANPPKGRFPGDYRTIVTRGKLNTITHDHAGMSAKHDASPRKTRPYPYEGTSSDSRGSTDKYYASTKEAYPQHAWAQQKDEWTGTVASIISNLFLHWYHGRRTGGVLILWRWLNRTVLLDTRFIGIWQRLRNDLRCWM